MKTKNAVKPQGPFPLEVSEVDSSDGLVTVITNQGNLFCQTYPSAARLIAAAPEILIALQNAVGLLAQDESGFKMEPSEVIEAVRIARAAIAKAEGEGR